MGANLRVIKIAQRTYVAAFFDELGEAGDPGIEPYVYKVPITAITRDGKIIWSEMAPELPRFTGKRLYIDGRFHEMDTSVDAHKVGFQVREDEFLSDAWRMYEQMARGLARNYPVNKRRLFVAMLLAGFGGEYGFTYDGQFLFDTDHIGRDAAGQAISQSNAWDLPFNGPNFDQVRAQMDVVRLQTGELIRGNQQRRYHVVVGPSKRAAAKAIFSLPGQNDNPFYQEATWEIWNELSGPYAEYWFVFDRSAPERARPFLFREPRGPRLVSRVAETDSNVFDGGMYQWGLDVWYGLAYGRWEFVAGSTGAGGGN